MTPVASGNSYVHNTPKPHLIPWYKFLGFITYEVLDYSARPSKTKIKKKSQMSGPLQHGLNDSDPVCSNWQALPDIGHGDRTQRNLFGKQQSPKLYGQ